MGNTPTNRNEDAPIIILIAATEPGAAPIIQSVGENGMGMGTVVEGVQ